MLLAVVVDGAAGSGSAEGVSVEDPHVDAVDLDDVGDLVLVPLGRPLREEVVALGHVRVGVDDAQSFYQSGHGSLSRWIVVGASKATGRPPSDSISNFISTIDSLMHEHV